MKPRSISLWLAVVAVLVAGGWWTSEIASGVEPASTDKERSASDDQPAAGPRRGGIPRDWLEPETPQPRARTFGRDDGASEGLEEGVPNFRVRPGFRPPDDHWFPPRSDWTLGVRAENAEVGVVVTFVLPGTAASRAGLERGDRIVAVGGHQVGFVGRELFPLGHELQRQAGRRGDVNLLVQNVRDRGLINLDVRLDRAGGRPRAGQD